MSSTPSTSHEVVICTRNRPDDMVRCLEHVLTSSEMPDVLVVDSSDTEDTLRVVESMQSRVPSGRTLRYVDAEPGLTRQRNIGLHKSTAEIVHFIDDDSFVSREYFAEILKVFTSLGQSTVGVGGVQTNVPLTPPAAIRRFFGLAGRPGRITHAGWNTNFYAWKSDIEDVDWLSGCSMSFKREVASEVGFDESMAGYSLGEDLEFCLRISQRGSLKIATRAELVHLRSDTNRLDLRAYKQREITFRRRIVAEHSERLSKPRFVTSLVGLCLISFVRVILRRSHAAAELRGIVAGALQSRQQIEPQGRRA